MSELLIQNARLLDAASQSDFVGDCLIKDGKIAELGANLTAPKKAKSLMPGDTCSPRAGGYAGAVVSSRGGASGNAAPPRPCVRPKRYH